MQLPMCLAHCGMAAEGTGVTSPTGDRTNSAKSGRYPTHPGNVQ